MPRDVLSGKDAESSSVENFDDWVRGHHKWLKAAKEPAKATAGDASRRNKRIYDQKTWGALIRPGERVLLRNHRARGRNKIQDRREPIPYLVIVQNHNQAWSWRLGESGASWLTKTLYVSQLDPERHMLPSEGLWLLPKLNRLRWPWHYHCHIQTFTRHSWIFTEHPHPLTTPSCWHWGCLILVQCRVFGPNSGVRQLG